jgi:hypothetical protein
MGGWIHIFVYRERIWTILSLFSYYYHIIIVQSFCLLSYLDLDRNWVVFWSYFNRIPASSFPPLQCLTGTQTAGIIVIYLYYYTIYTLQYFIILYCTLLYTILYYTPILLYYTTPSYSYPITLYYTILLYYYTILHPLTPTLLHYTILYSYTITLYYTLLLLPYYTILYYTPILLHYTTPSYSYPITLYYTILLYYYTILHPLTPTHTRRLGVRFGELGNRGEPGNGEFGEIGN